MSIAPIAAPVPVTAPTRRRLRVLVGVHDGVLSGVNTYVEHVAAAAATAVEDVVLAVAHDTVAAEVGARLAGTGVRVVSLGMEPSTPGQRRLDRLSPGYAARRLATALEAARPRIGDGFDAVHLNHPHLAAAARPMGSRVYVAAWYHPHALVHRVVGTWDQSGRRFPRSAVLALKGVSHHRNDARGYRAADVAVAPTRVLADQLRQGGIEAVQCTPPARVLDDPHREDQVPQRVPGSPLRLLVCSGDLGHPRKNVRLAVEAVALLGRGGGRWQLELVGGNAGALRPALARMPGTVSVTISGRLPAGEVHRRMRGADLLLFPSRFEEWGFVAVEAALQGTPVVTLPVYPFAEMLEAPYGFIASGDGASDYAEALAAALDAGWSRTDVAAAAERRFGIVGVGERLGAIWAGEEPVLESTLSST